MIKVIFWPLGHFADGVARTDSGEADVEPESTQTTGRFVGKAVNPFEFKVIWPKKQQARSVVWSAGVNGQRFLVNGTWNLPTTLTFVVYVTIETQGLIARATARS